MSSRVLCIYRAIVPVCLWQANGEVAPIFQALFILDTGFTMSLSSLIHTFTHNYWVSIQESIQRKKRFGPEASIFLYQSAYYPH